jgi:hypothetical protein
MENYGKKKKKDPCWKGHEQAGAKKKIVRTVPNCINSEKGEKKK